MLKTVRPKARDERGFTLIELLVVILIIGVLAAIAIPSFLNQKSKATDASAKELARTAQTAAETLATDNQGSYLTVSTVTLNGIEKTIPITPSTTSAYLSGAGPTSVTDGSGYSVTATAADGASFTIANAAGAVSRTCNPGPNNSAGCPNPASW